MAFLVVGTSEVGEVKYRLNEGWGGNVLRHGGFCATQVPTLLVLLPRIAHCSCIIPLLLQWQTLYRCR